MAVGDVTAKYRASSNLTVTNLHGIASSSTWLSGWTSGTIDNTSNLDLDVLVSAKFVAESSGLSAGEIRVYVYAMLDDSNWPDIFSSGTEGTEGTATLHDTEIRDALPVLFIVTTDTSASRPYPMISKSIAALFGGQMPPKCALFVAQSTGTTLETTGNQVTVKGVSANVAAS
jgi:hypothetical protein